MRLAHQLPVFHFTAADEEKSIELRRTIRECLAAGLDVLVVCSAGVRRRMARMALAVSKHENEFPGCKLAVVTPNVDEFKQSLPGSVMKDLGIFESKSQAIQWMSVADEKLGARSTVVWPAAC